MHVFMTGAGGYIGGAIAARLIAQGHRVSGLVRSPEKAAALESRGIEPVMGALSDLAIVGGAARAADAVINAASAEDSPAAYVMLDALAGSKKPFLHTSGTSVAADRACGEPGTVVFSEDMPLPTLPERLLRVAVEHIVLLGAGRGVRTVVIRPSLIYGQGTGLNPHSHQLPRLVALAKERGHPAHVGRGLNVWSNVHIDDVAELYLLALEQAPPGSTFFAETGEASWRDMAAGVGRTLGFQGEPEALDLDESLRVLGISAVTSFGSNSRVTSEKARRMLGWKATGPSLWMDLEGEYYRTGLPDIAHSRNLGRDGPRNRHPL